MCCRKKTGAAMTESGSKQSRLFWSTAVTFVSSFPEYLPEFVSVDNFDGHPCLF